MQDLLVKTRFVSLLTLRKLLNALQGVNEDFLDNLTECDEFKNITPEQLDVSDMISYSYDKTLVSKLNVDEAKCHTLQGMVSRTFSSLMLVCQSQIKPHDMAKAIGDIMPELLGESTDHDMPGANISSARAYKVLKKDLDQANVKIQDLQINLKTREDLFDKIKKTLLRDLVHLRESVISDYLAIWKRHRKM